MTTELDIGDAVTVQDKYHTWRGGIITAIKEQSFQIRLRHPEDDEERESPTKWVNAHEIFKEPQDLKYIDKQPFPEHLTSNVSRSHPKYYFDNVSNKHYIIIANNWTTSTYTYSNAIHFYDIDKDEYVREVDYPDYIRPLAHGMAVDSGNHIIHFYWSNEMNSKFPHFAIYNIVSNEWSIHKYEDDKLPLLKYPRAWFIDSAMYFKSRNNYFMKYSPENKTCVDITHPESKLIWSKTCYDEQNRKLMLFGGTLYDSDDSDANEPVDDIWTYDIDQDDKTAKWELYPLKLPYKEDYTMELVSGFDSIIFVLYCHEDEMDEIWCLELISKQWFKSDALYPYELHLLEVIKVNDNHIYCMQDSTINVSIDLYDMIPVELFQFYSKYYQPLIYGYIRLEFENEYQELHISQDLKRLIAKYFNAFL